MWAARARRTGAPGRRALAAALALVLVGAPAQAAEKPAPADVQRAEELYDNGRALFAEGSYAAAATAFEEAYGLSGNLDMLYNAALAHDRAGAFEQAIAALDRYRALAPASERETLDQRKQSLQLRLDKQREEAARAARPSEPERDTLMPRGQPESSERERRATRVRPATWALLGSSAAGFVVAAGLGGVSLARTRAAEDGCVEGDGGLLCGSDVSDDAQSSRPLAIGADVMLAVSGALAVAFIAVLVVDLRKPSKPPNEQPAARLRPGPGGLVMHF